MKLPISWARAYADIECTAKEFADKMTMTGSKVETWESEAEAIKNVVIGRVESLVRHPNSDHLWICQVNVGEETVQIVTGAQNLKAGDICPVALHGAKLPSGLEIKRGKLRGEPSNGMLCSLGELNLTTHDFPTAIEDGIFVLDTADFDPMPDLGADAAKVLGMDEEVFEFEITPNRPDCLSVRGLAREAAATFKVPFNDHVPAIPADTHGDVNALLKAKVECPDLCLRYSAAVVENVRIKPSPLWLRARLRAAGVRPINNIVDITNYVMLEYGQPMHAFDYAYVNGASITVRRAYDGEGIMTLDGVERKLDADMMVIADEKGPIAIAGIMGGEYSGVYDTTKRIVFESACFDGPSVRTTAKRLGMQTESAARYAKGLAPESAQPALARALELVRELDAGDIVTGVVDDFPRPREEREVPLRLAAINALLGIEVSRGEAEDILTPLGFTINGNNVVVPTTRYDVARYNDLAEEIARFVGYNNIPSTTLRGTAAARRTQRQDFENRVAGLLAGWGLWECETYSFYSAAQFDVIRLPAHSPLRNAVRLMNPLGEETSIMRTTALPSILEVAAHNWAARTEQCAVYELATEYIPGDNPDDLPAERRRLVIAAYGEGWDYLAMKGIVDALTDACRVENTRVLRNSEGTTYHPGRCGDVMIELGDDGRGACGQLRLATVGELHPAVVEGLGIKPRVMAAEIDLDLLFERRGGTPQYHPLPKFPAITRDLAVVADDSVTAQDIEAAIRKGCGRLLESIALFDIYTGEKVGEGKKSLAYSLVLRDAQGTLTDADAQKAVDKSLTLLGGLGVALRM